MGTLRNKEIDRFRLCKVEEYEDTKADLNQRLTAWYRMLNFYIVSKADKALIDKIQNKINELENKIESEA